MKAFQIISILAFACYLPLAEGAIYQYIFTGSLKSEIPSSEGNNIGMSAPISGTLTLDVTSTGESDLLIPENFATTAAELKLLIGKSIRVSATESKVSGQFTSGSPRERSSSAAVGFKPDNIVHSASGSFPATLAVARPNASSSPQELSLTGLDISFNAALLSSLKIGDSTAGGLSGSFKFGEGDNAQKIDFAATNIQRKEHEETISPYIQREWQNLKAHLANLGAHEAIDDVTFQNFDIGDSDLDPIGFIPEPSSAPTFIALLTLLAISRRKR